MRFSDHEQREMDAASGLALDRQAEAKARALASNAPELPSVEGDRPWPCSLKEGVLTPCWALDGCLQGPYGRGTRQQGLILNSMVNLDTHKFSRNLVSIKSGDYGKKGLVANHCPFCGTLINEDARDRT